MNTSKIILIAFSILFSIIPLIFFNSIDINFILVIHINVFILNLVIFRNIFSPYIWVFPVFYFYQFSSFYLHLSNQFRINNYEQILYISVFSFFAINISLIFFSIVDKKHIENINLPSVFDFFVSNNLKLAFYFFSALFVSYNLLFLFVFRVSRTDQFLLGIYRFAYIQQWFSVMLFIYLLRIKRNLFIYLILLLVAVTSTFITGERDIFVWIGLMITYFIYLEFKRNLFLTGFYLVGIIFIFTILNNYRNIAVTGVVYSTSQQNIIDETFSGEPLYATANLDVVLTGDSNTSYVINDVLSIFIPKFIYYIEDSINWFHKEYFPEMVTEGSGRGYTLIGSFFIGNGYMGLFFGIFIICFFLHKVYILGENNPLFLAISIFMIPIFSLAMRGNINTVFGEVIRIFLPVFLILRLPYYLRYYKIFSAKF